MANSKGKRTGSLPETDDKELLRKMMDQDRSEFKASGNRIEEVDIGISGAGYHEYKIAQRRRGGFTQRSKDWGYTGKVG